VAGEVAVPVREVVSVVPARVVVAGTDAVAGFVDVEAGAAVPETHW
jgi:hypothetical protein